MSLQWDILSRKRSEKEDLDEKIILALLALSAIAQAQTTTYRDAYGTVTGTSTQNGDKTQYRDAYSTTSGTVVVNGDRVQYREAYGAPSRTANTNSTVAL